MAANSEDNEEESVKDQLRDLTDDQLKEAHRLCSEQIDERIEELVALHGDFIWDVEFRDPELEDLRDTLKTINAESKRRIQQ